jgi:hypothetical protein
MQLGAAMEHEIFYIGVSDAWLLIVRANYVVLGTLALLLLAAYAVLQRLGSRDFFRKTFEIDSAQFGLGDHSVTFKPNDLDRQIAYSLWVEISTRKIGLPIDLDHDVISEIYDSWYSFFGITRDLMKAVPVTKYKRDSTQKIIQLSMRILNEGLRPHLTQWQARYRRWYEHEIEKQMDASPQEIQAKYPSYDELTSDLLQINNRLIAYREEMHRLVRES